MESINYKKLQIEILITEREAMIAENKQRELQGKALAYDEQAFLALQNRFYDLQRL